MPWIVLQTIWRSTLGVKVSAEIFRKVVFVMRLPQSRCSLAMTCYFCHCEWNEEIIGHCERSAAISQTMRSVVRLPLSRCSFVMTCYFLSLLALNIVENNTRKYTWGEWNEAISKTVRSVMRLPRSPCSLAMTCYFCHCERSVAISQTVRSVMRFPRSCCSFVITIFRWVRRNRRWVTDSHANDWDVYLCNHEEVVDSD